MNGISALRKEPQSFPDFSTMWRHSEPGNRLSDTKSAVDCEQQISIVCHILLREGNGNPLQYSCLENPMDGGAW